MKKIKLRNRLLASTSATVFGAAALAGLSGQAQAQSATCATSGIQVTCSDATGVIATGSIFPTSGVNNGGIGIEVSATDTITGTMVGTAPLHTEGEYEHAINLYAGGTIAFTYEGSVSTAGENSQGLAVSAGDSPSGGSAIITVGNITTTGYGAEGADIFGADVVDAELGNVSTAGSGAEGIIVASGNVSVLTAGTVTTTGPNSAAVTVRAGQPEDGGTVAG